MLKALALDCHSLDSESLLIGTIYMETQVTNG